MSETYKAEMAAQRKISKPRHPPNERNDKAAKIAFAKLKELLR